MNYALFDGRLSKGASHVRATSAGWYYSTHLIRSFAYLDLVLQDTPLNDETVTDQLQRSVREVDNLADREDQKLQRMEVRFNRVQEFLNYLEAEEQQEIKYHRLANLNSVLADPITPKVIEAFARQHSYIQARLRENREKLEEEGFVIMTEEEIRTIMAEHYEAETPDQEDLPFQTPKEQ